MVTKEEILQEIQKTAKENGGIPLGRDRFAKETGITVWEIQKYWPRFSDAQREAGFTPNILNTAFNEEFVFEKYISLMRELGKIPVRGDLRVRRHSDSKFPTDGVFGRFGTKSQLVSKILKYAKGKGYKDVARLCQAELNKVTKEEQQEESSVGIISGSVYLAKSGKYYKIGRTNSLGRRHHEITILLPEGFALIYEIKTDDPSGVENYWHRRFEQKRKTGEWFDLNSSDVKAFKRWRRIF